MCSVLFADRIEHLEIKVLRSKTDITINLKGYKCATSLLFQSLFIDLNCFVRLILKNKVFYKPVQS